MNYYSPKAGIQQVFPSLKFSPRKLIQLSFDLKQQQQQQQKPFKHFVREVEFAGSAARLHKNKGSER